MIITFPIVAVAHALQHLRWGQVIEFPVARAKARDKKLYLRRGDVIQLEEVIAQRKRRAHLGDIYNSHLRPVYAIGDRVKLRSEDRYGVITATHISLGAWMSGRDNNVVRYTVDFFGVVQARFQDELELAPSGSVYHCNIGADYLGGEN